MLQQLGWWKRGALVQDLNYNTKLTFYVKHGDYIARSAFYIGILLLISMLLQAIISKIKKVKSK